MGNEVGNEVGKKINNKVESKLHSYLPPALATLAGGAIAYPMLRYGKGKGLASTFKDILGGKGDKIVKLIPRKDPLAGKGEPSLLNKAYGLLHRNMMKAMYGADEVMYEGAKGKYTPPKEWFKDSAGNKHNLVTNLMDMDIYDDLLKKMKAKGLGGRVIGRRSPILDSKLQETEFFNKYIKNIYPKSEVLPKGIGTTRNAEKVKAIEGLIEKKKGDFIIKPAGVEAFGDSGVGGVGFPNKKDLIDFARMGKIDPKRYANRMDSYKKKSKILQDMLKNPKEYIIQNKIEISKDPLAGTNKEFRVHMFGDKLVDVMPREKGFANIKDSYLTKKVHDFVQKKYIDKVNKLPKEVRDKVFKNVFQALDVAETPSGYKIIETNAGPMLSGFTDPLLLSKKDPKSLLYWGIPAAISNQKMYRALTGRRGAPSALLGAATAGAGAGGATLAIQEREAIKEKAKKILKNLRS